MLRKLKDLVYMNRYLQLSASELEDLKEEVNEVSLLPSSNDYGWFTSFKTGGDYVNTAEIITLGRARYANIKYCNGPFISSNNQIVESKNKNALRTKYLYYFLNYTSRTYYVDSTSYPKFEKDIFENTMMQVPEIALQDARIKELESLNIAISVEKHRVSKLDSLIKSRFNEIVSSIKSRVSLNDVCVGKPEYGAQSAAAPFEPSRPRYIRITDINDDGTLNDDVMCSSNISDDLKYKLSTGDILFARTGATVGKTYLGSEKNEIFAGYLIRFKLNAQKILPEFLFSYTKTDEYWNWVKLKQSGSGQPGTALQQSDRKRGGRHPGGGQLQRIFCHEHGAAPRDGPFCH